MTWPTAILTYNDGSEFEVNAGNVPGIFATLPTTGGAGSPSRVLKGG